MNIKEKALTSCQCCLSARIEEPRSNIYEFVESKNPYNMSKWRVLDNIFGINIYLTFKVVTDEELHAY
jgi:hypothetical protein